MADALLTEGSIAALAPTNLVNEAEEAVRLALSEVNEAAEGYSPYFLKEEIRLEGETFSVASEPLRHMIDIVTAVTSMGPHNQRDYDHGDILCGLAPSSWFRVSTALIAGILRGCVRTPDIAKRGRFDFEPCLDDFIFSNELARLQSQGRLLGTMAAQLMGHLSQDHPHVDMRTVESLKQLALTKQEKAVEALVAERVAPIKERYGAMAFDRLIAMMTDGVEEEDVLKFLEEEELDKARVRHAGKLASIADNELLRLASEDDARLQIMAKEGFERAVQREITRLTIASDPTVLAQEAFDKRVDAHAQTLLADFIPAAEERARRMAEARAYPEQVAEGECLAKIKAQSDFEVICARDRSDIIANAKA